jgi:hypothetical protein
MALSAERRTPPIAGIETELDQNDPVMPRSRTGMRQPGNTSMVYYILAALVLLVVGYYFFGQNVNSVGVTPAVTQAPPPPVVAPAEVDPPKVDAPSQTPAVTPSTTPPAQAPIVAPTDQKLP